MRPRHLDSTRPALLTAAGALVIAGCWSSGFEVADVRGTVILDGKPAAGVMLEFVPEGRGDVRLPPAYGVTGADGAYVARDRQGKPGAVVGRHRIALSPVEGGTTTIPGAYLGDHAPQREIKPGENVVDFDLTSAPQPR